MGLFLRDGRGGGVLSLWVGIFVIYWVYLGLRGLILGREGFGFVGLFRLARIMAKL